MPAAASGPARLLRASVIAATSVALALVAHVLGGGAVPPATVVGPLVAVVLAAAVPFSGRTGAVGAIALLALGQLGLHYCLDALAGMGCAPATDMAEHVHTMQLACTTAPPQMASPHLAGGSLMVVLHVVATMVTALLITGTDRALAWITTWLGPLVASRAPVALPAFALLGVRVETTRVVDGHDGGIVPLRGPPTSPAHVTLAA